MSFWPGTARLHGGAWRRTLLAAMANYIDAGSIVAGAVSLPIWAAYFGFGDSFVSFLPRSARTRSRPASAR